MVHIVNPIQIKNGACISTEVSFCILQELLTILYRVTMAMESSLVHVLFYISLFEMTILNLPLLNLKS